MMSFARNSVAQRVGIPRLKFYPPRKMQGLLASSHSVAETSGRCLIVVVALLIAPHRTSSFNSTRTAIQDDMDSIVMIQVGLNMPQQQLGEVGRAVHNVDKSRGSGSAADKDVTERTRVVATQGVHAITGVRLADNHNHKVSMPSGPLGMNNTLMDENLLPKVDVYINGDKQSADWLQEYPLAMYKIGEEGPPAYVPAWHGSLLSAASVFSSAVILITLNIMK